MNDVRACSILILVQGNCVLQKGDQKLPLTAADVVFVSAELGAVALLDASADLLAFRAFTPAAAE